MANNPTVRELSDPYANFMLNPLAPATPGVCDVCLTFISREFSTCYPCGHGGRHADAVLPISFSVDGGQLHDALRGYKGPYPRPARDFRMQLAAVLWRFLREHEQCLARRTGVEGFDLVTTVPSGARERDEAHPLRRIAGKIVGQTRDRYERLLVRSEAEVEPRVLDLARYDAVRALDGEAVLLVEDTWVTGANAQSAAARLKASGAGAVGVVVIGRHIHADYGDNAARLKALTRRFDWERCALE